MILYQALDFAVTVTEVLSLVVLMTCLLKKPKFNPFIIKVITFITLLLATYLFTWFTKIGALKIIFLGLLIILLLKMCYKDSLIFDIATIEIWLTIPIFFVEAIILGLTNFVLKDNATTEINGQLLVQWWIYLILIVIRLIVIAICYKALKNFKYEIQMKDLEVLSVVFLFVFFCFFVVNYNLLNLNTTEAFPLYGIGSLFCFLFIIQFLYSKNTMYIRELEKENEFKIDKMQKQFEYYQSKQADEERIKVIYHDMKNHLLVLQNKENTVESQKMIKELQNQIESYENYEHTGNSFLDIIIKDKLKIAKEKEIDLMVAIDFKDINFIESLDISTIFGNALDNAIEGVEKVSKENRVILVKAGKVNNFISIVVENNYNENEKLGNKKTTKKDTFLHGYGISNIKNAVKKYSGTCTITKENRKFTLKILIPNNEKGDNNE